MLGIAGPKPGSSVHRESGLSPRCDSTSQGTSEENTVDSDLGDSHASTAGLDLGPVMGRTPLWLGGRLTSSVCLCSREVLPARPELPLQSAQTEQRHQRLRKRPAAVGLWDFPVQNGRYVRGSFRQR